MYMADFTVAMKAARDAEQKQINSERPASLMTLLSSTTIVATVET